MCMNNKQTKIENAASIVVVRYDNKYPMVLMGKRNANSSFMPDKYVFPGGKVDLDDLKINLANEINVTCRANLDYASNPKLVNGLCAASIRELFEETGHILGIKGKWDETAPDNWREFLKSGYRPDAAGLRFIFRAVTPPGYKRRFDTRFFLVNAEWLATDLSYFFTFSDELLDLRWIRLERATDFDIPFITSLVLNEVENISSGNSNRTQIPYFKDNDENLEYLKRKKNIEN